MPEISCGDGCIDTSRLIGFGNFLRSGSTASYYRKVFGGMGVVIELVYPKVSSSGLCDMKAYQDTAYPDSCDRWVIASKEQGASVSTAVTLYYPELDQYRMGRLVLTL
jgi:hypothetical protein